MISKITLITIVLLIFASSAMTVSNRFEPQDKTGGEVIIPEEEKISTDLRIIAGNIVIAGEVTGKLEAGGGNIIISGVIGEQVLVAGGNVNIPGTLKQGISVFGGNIEINGMITGETRIFGAKVRLTGNFNGPIEITGGRVEIDGIFSGNVILSASEAVIGPNAVIEGDLEYWARKGIEIDPAATIKGEKRDNEELAQKYWKTVPRRLKMMVTLFIYASMALALLLFHLFFPGRLQKTIDNMQRKFTQSMLIGFLTLIGIPVLIFILAILIIGIPSAVFLGAVYLALLFLSMSFGAIFIVSVIKGGITGNGKISPLLALIPGYVVLYIISMIPVVGGIGIFILMIAGLGGLVVSIHRKQEPETVPVVRDSDYSGPQPPYNTDNR